MCLCVQIDRLKVQLSQQETNNRAQAEELDKLKQQLEQLRKEELEYKYKVWGVAYLVPMPRPFMGCGYFPSNISSF